MPDGDNPNFDDLRAEAQPVLDALLAPPGDLGTTAGMNLELARTRAWAQFDCWAPKWLKHAFEEVDRLRTEVEDYRASICFETTCTGCARMLDRLAAAEAETERQASWSDLRQRQVQAVLDLHVPVEVEQVWGPMEANYCGPLVCGECGESFPCNTRKAVLNVERAQSQPKEG